MKKQAPYARKRFGQHYLKNPSIIHQIVSAANIHTDDHVFEIGPGKGDLTVNMLPSANLVTAVEIDRDRFAELNERFADNQNFVLINQDVLDCDWDSLFQAPVKIIANLPYNISTPILFQMLRHRHLIHSATIMVQKEVADRILDNGTGKRLNDYGILALATSAFFERRRICHVPPSSFDPPPKVDSSVIQLVPKKSQVDGKETAYLQFIKWAFNQRRKQLLPRIRKEQTELFSTLSEECRSYLEGKRPENISPDLFERLFLYGDIEAKESQSYLIKNDH